MRFVLPFSSGKLESIAVQQWGAGFNTLAENERGRRISRPAGRVTKGSSKASNSPITSTPTLALVDVSTRFFLPLPTCDQFPAIARERRLIDAGALVPGLAQNFVTRRNAFALRARERGNVARQIAGGGRVAVRLPFGLHPLHWFRIPQRPARMRSGDNTARPTVANQKQAKGAGGRSSP